MSRPMSSLLPGPITDDITDRMGQLQVQLIAQQQTLLVAQQQRNVDPAGLAQQEQALFALCGQLQALHVAANIQPHLPALHTCGNCGQCNVCYVGATQEVAPMEAWHWMHSVDKASYEEEYERYLRQRDVRALSSTRREATVN